jgi:SWI/SNF-related matrix-associated actin-dependent regulator 1 of chromatin subfamily A
MSTSTVNIESVLPWGPARLVDTSRGLRQVRSATPDKGFWDLWRANKETLKSRGVSIKKDDFGNWSASLWTDAPVEYIAKLEASQADDADIVIPAPEGLSYAGYQKAGVLFAHTDSTLTTLKRGVLIGDEMGLGKTIEAIGIINLHPELRKVLIVTPSSIKINWRNELRRWLVDGRSVGLARSTDLPDTDIVIINFDILKQNHHALLTREFDLLIIDEAHGVRNTKTQRYAYLKPLATKHVVALTGTPIWNKADDLWALLTLLVPDQELSTKWADWKKFRYCQGRPNRQAELNRRLREDVMIRRMKADVLKELPPKRRQVVQLPATGAAYDAVRAEIEAYQARQTRMNELRSAMLLAKVSEDRDAYHKALAELKYEAKVSFEELSRVRHQTVLAKLDHIVEHLTSLHEEDPSRKIIFFAHHRDVLEHISRAFGNAPIVYGGMTPEAKQAAVDRFNTDPSTWIIGGSIRAMGLGFNMTSSSWVVFGELDWTPATVTQCEDRTHRMGQTADHIMVQHLTLEGSLDARMAHIILEKQEVMDGAVGALENDEPVVVDMNVEMVTLSNRELAKSVLDISEAQIDAIHHSLKILAGVCDFAQSRDDCGFNGCDTIIGHSLAGQSGLSAKQAVLGKKILKKYHRQIPSSIYGVIFN